MSSALAIASVTYVLKDLLNNGLIDQNVSGATGGNVSVISLPPDRIDITSGGQSQLGLYMYRVSYNTGWSNQSFPSRNPEGEMISNPPLSLNLHYLLTSYGVNELHSEILLGYGMQIMHEAPVLDRQSIRRSLATSIASGGGGLPEEFRVLATSGLADQVQQIKITPENLSVEEISKLWTAFGSKYRPTAAFQVSVVLIESKKSVKSALRVSKTNIYANPFIQPVIQKIKSQAAKNEPILEDQPILAGHNLVLTGRQFLSDKVTVKTGGLEIHPDAENITDKQIIIAVPSQIAAGVKSVQVIHYKLMGSPAFPHQGIESNVAAFVLRPEITGQPAYQPEEERISITVNPPLHENQRVILFMNELKDEQENQDPPRAYSFHLAPEILQNLVVPAETVTFSIKGVKPGTYLLRIQVDGAESLLTPDASGRYYSPNIIIT